MLVGTGASTGAALLPIKTNDDEDVEVSKHIFSFYCPEIKSTKQVINKFKRGGVWQHCPLS